MTPARRVLTMTAILFAVTTLFSWVAWRLGFQGFLIAGSVDVPLWVEILTTHLLFYLEIFVLISVSTKIYSRKIFNYFIPLVAVDVLVCQLIMSMTSVDTMAVSSLLPLIYVLVCVIIKGNAPRGALRAFVVFAVVGVYQALSIFLLTGTFTFAYNYVSFYQRLVFAIDMSICWALIYFYNLGGCDESKTKLSFLDEKIYENHKGSDDESVWLSKLSPRQRAAAYCFDFLVFQIPQWLFILFVVHLGNAFLRGLAITVSFVCHGFIIRKKWHSNSIIVCSLASAAMFYVAARALPPYRYTQLLPIVVGLLLLYALYRVANYQEEARARQEKADSKCSKLQAELDAQALPLTLDTITDEQLRRLCANIGMARKDTEICVDAFILNLTPKDIWKIHDFPSYDAAQKKVRRLRERLLSGLTSQ